MILIPVTPKSINENYLSNNCFCREQSQVNSDKKNVEDKGAKQAGGDTGDQKIKDSDENSGAWPWNYREWRIYEDWQKERLDAIPGCTGVWQVCGRSEVNFEENVLMDIYYNQNYSIWFDVKIMLKTVYVMLSGKGGE